MSYSVETITSKGSEIFAILTDPLLNHLVFTGCYAVKNVIDLSTALNSGDILNDPSSGWSNTDWLHTTNIEMSGVTTDTINHVSNLMVYAQFKSGEIASHGSWDNNKLVRTFYLHGHLDTDPNTEYVLAVASDSIQSRIPENNDIINFVEVRFSLTFTALDANSTITTASNNFYVTRSEYTTLTNNITTLSDNLVTLSDRVVTTHIEGNTTTGENQTVYGQKSFINGINTSTLSGISPDPIIVTSNINPLTQNIELGYPNYFVNVCAKKITYGYDTNSLTTSVASGEVSGKTATSRISVHTGVAGGVIRAFTRDLGNDVLEQRSALEVYNRSGNLVGGLTVFRDETGSGSVYIEGLVGSNKFTFDGVDFIITNSNLTVGGNLIPDSDRTRDIGSGATGVEKRWKDGYISTIKTKYIKSLDQNGVFLMSSLLPSNAVINIGSDDSKIKTIYTNSGYAGCVYTDKIDTWIGLSITTNSSIIPDNGASSLTLGSSLNKFDEVHANKLYGIIDHPTAHNSDPPVGSIVFISVTFDDTNQHTINVGDEVKVQSGGPSGMYYASYDSDNKCFSTPSPIPSLTGTYRALSMGNKGSGTSYEVFVLAIRVA